MSKRQKRTERGLRYQALAEGYRLLKPELAETYQFVSDHYEHSDPPLEPERAQALRQPEEK